MPKLPSYGRRPCILLTNDDGPPSASSPNIYGFCRILQETLGWDVRVVIPDCQKSWVGKSYAIQEVITASYFYPLAPDGLQGEVTAQSRPLRDGELMEWVLLSGTPASCSNIALHNLFPGEIDLVVSGPNHGRNSSTAFALSSGTLGAALAAALSYPIPGPSTQSSLHTTHMPAIALSYGVVDRPVPDSTTALAHEAAVEVVARLFNDWGHEEDGSLVQVYTVNIPLVEKALIKDRRKVCWTRMWRNSYGSLFKPTQLELHKNWWKSKTESTKTETNNAGPGAVPDSHDTPTADASTAQLQFHFSPSMGPLLSPSRDTVPVGTDAWAFAEGYISVTPLKAEYSQGGTATTDGVTGSMQPGTFWS